MKNQNNERKLNGRVICKMSSGIAVSESSLWGSIEISKGSENSEVQRLPAGFASEQRCICTAHYPMLYTQPGDSEPRQCGPYTAYVFTQMHFPLFDFFFFFFLIYQARNRGQMHAYEEKNQCPQLPGRENLVPVTSKTGNCVSLRRTVEAQRRGTPRRARAGHRTPRGPRVRSQLILPGSEPPCPAKKPQHGCHLEVTLQLAGEATATRTGPRRPRQATFA